MTDQDRLAAHGEAGDQPAEGPPEQPPADDEAGGRPDQPAPPAGTGQTGPRDYRPVGMGGGRPGAAQPRYAPASPSTGWQPPGAAPWQQPVPWQQQPPGAAPYQQPGSGPLQTTDLEARWSWQRSLAGALVGFAPEALLALAAYATGTASGGSPTQVSVGSGIVLVVSSLVFYGWQLFAAWLFSLRGVAHTLLALGYRRPTLAYFWVIPLVLAVSYAVIIANDAVLHPPQQNIVESFPQTAAGIVLFTLLAVVMAPLAEETFFRGFVFRGFAASWGFFPGAAVSGAVFSLAHLQLTLFVPLFVLGFGLAWAYKRTGSLWTNITIHAIFNGISVLAWALS